MRSRVASVQGDSDRDTSTVLDPSRSLAGRMRVCWMDQEIPTIHYLCLIFLQQDSQTKLNPTSARCSRSAPTGISHGDSTDPWYGVMRMARYLWPFSPKPNPVWPRGRHQRNSIWVAVYQVHDQPASKLSASPTPGRWGTVTPRYSLRDMTTM